ncbi:hypothetical protein FA10DRAFT_304948 [Acaromyces ingoldii]|uniref:Band 7 domain-containing protein n=1 Tax=Acaromyces ingoldii TaxID=215250 RepID=A0A316YEJ4_9BASI|nr:hypothetical protein FA10DRAFT_304948 [Acaromyces ingoldii]PWN86473.1 hypothetical protein FA10DRAFT_304948 [Acaromyces ingoldii]
MNDNGHGDIKEQDGFPTAFDSKRPEGSQSSKVPTVVAPGRVPQPNQEGIITVQPLRKSDMQPSYAQDLGLSDVKHGFYGSLINCLGDTAGALGQFPCCPCPNPFKQVRQGSVGLVSRFGQFYKSVDPGLVKINPCSESLRIVDVKIQLIIVPQQRVTTRDNVSIEVDSVIYWHVSNPYRAAYGIQDIHRSLVERAQTTLRDVVGSRTIQSVISDRTEVAHQVEEILETVASKWGVVVESILIKDIIFSRELQESLSSAATQRRIGESKVIAAKAEVDAAKLMRQAADILSSPAAMQIRQLESLQAMAKSAGSKVIFVPMNLNDVKSSVLADGTGVVHPDTHGVGDTAVSPVCKEDPTKDVARLSQLTQL